MSEIDMATLDTLELPLCPVSMVKGSAAQFAGTIDLVNQDGILSIIAASFAGLPGGPGCPVALA